MRDLAVLFSLSCDCELLPKDRSGLCSVQDLSGLPVRLDGYSEAALEYAFRLRDQSAALGETVRVWGVAPEGNLPEVLAQNLFAAGCDRLVTLGLEGDAAFSPGAVAEAVAAVLREQPWDLVLMGWQESMPCDGTLGVFLARRLGVPYFGPLSDLERTEDGVRLCRTLRTGIQRGVVSGPAVCALGNSEHPYLRMATLREKLAAMEKQAEARSVALPDAGDARLTGLRARPPRGETVWLAGNTAGEKAERLLETVFGWKEGGVCGSC